MIGSIAALLLAAPASPPSASCGGITLASMVARYASLVRTQDRQGIAALFAADGELVNPGGAPIVGPEAIAAHLAKFSDFKVATETMEIAQVTGGATEWRAEGRFRQSGTMPDKRPYTTSGRFASDWTCNPAGQWRLRRLQTVG